MKRAHRVALKPTPDQESLFSQHAGYTRNMSRRLIVERRCITLLNASQQTCLCALG